MKQEEYIQHLADKNYEKFYRIGHAEAGHNGPHGHLDTPVRNTSHYLIIYSYLYKELGRGGERYLSICHKFSQYICEQQKKSVSGAIKCMETDKFDHLNGLIGQGWVIEALLYYYEISHDSESLEAAYSIYKSQKYDYELHLWHRVELDGTDIGIDNTYNHQVWFAACSHKLSEYKEDKEINREIIDFLTYTDKRDLRVYTDGLLHHSVNLGSTSLISFIKKTIKWILYPIKWLYPKKLDDRYMEYAYHLFDLYGLCILKQNYGNLPVFNSPTFQKAVNYARDIDGINAKLWHERNNTRSMNVYGYPYNSPAFEYPYVSMVCGFNSDAVNDNLFEIQKKLMFNDSTNLFDKNNPDIDTWNARTYEIIRYLEMKKSTVLVQSEDKG